VSSAEPAVPAGYDVAISYARENGAVVRDSLYHRLCRCQTTAGAPSRVFMDEGRPDGVLPGHAFHDALATAIQQSRAVVLVYSRDYFDSRMCWWESKLALLAATGREAQTKLVPLLLEPKAEALVPFPLQPFHFIDMRQDDWFETLCGTVGLIPQTTRLELAFVAQPRRAIVNSTLPRIEVEVRGDGPAGGRAVEVTISSDRGDLTGTRTRTVHDGIAVFDDLSFTSPGSAMLIASCAGGSASAVSERFPVVEPAAPTLADDQRMAAHSLDAHGQAVHFLGDDALAVRTPGRLELLDLTGRQRASGDAPGRPRLLRCSDSMVVLATWEGELHVGTSDGRFSTSTFDAGRDAITVPGDVALAPGHRVYVGFWNGSVFRLAGGEDWPPDLVLDHPDGVQALALAGEGVGERLYVCGLDGQLHLYERGRLLPGRSYRLQGIVRHLRAFRQAVLAVGTTQLFRIPLDGGEVLDEPLPIGEVSAVFGDTDVPVVVDAEGRGVRVDDNLSIWGGFRAAAGAVPCSADRAGRVCVLANPDGTRSLVVEGRVVLTHPDGRLAVSPSGDHVALGDDRGLGIVPVRDFAE
jgi:hypothetical protein